MSQASFHANPATKALFVTYILTLGFQRLTFATGDRTFWPWVFLLLTHLIETWMWWTLGLEAGYMNGYAGTSEMLVDIVTMNHKKSPFAILLVLVPVIVGVFLVAGPEVESAGSKNPKKKKQ